MLKKLLITAGCIALSGTLTSCSYFKSFTNSKPETSYEETEEVSAAPTEDIVQHHHMKHKHKHDNAQYHRMRGGPTTVIVSEDGLRETTCTEVIYTSAANKIQTLGYISADTPIPQKAVKVVQHPKKAKPKVKKPKAVKTDSYNAPAATTPEPQAEATPVEPTPAARPVEVQTSTPPAVEPMTPDNVTIPEPTKTTPPAPVTVTPPTLAPTQAPMPTPVTVPNAPVTTPNLPVTTPTPPATPMSTQVAPTSNSMQNTPAAVTTTPMANDQAPGVSNTVSVGRLATLDYTESQVDIPTSGSTTLDQIATDLKQNPGKNVKIQSYAFSKDGNVTEARRNSLQRAIKVRKYLIDKDVSASRISVNAIEDINNKLNKVEISFEEAKQ